MEGDNHILWLKILNRHRRYVNGLDIVVLPQNPLGQVTTHNFFVGPDPSGVPACLLKRFDVSSILVRPSDDSSIHHQINEAYAVYTINIALRGFPSSHKQVNVLVGRPKPQRNEFQEVHHNLSLKTQRDTIISVQVSYKQIYIYDPLKKMKNNITSSKVM